MLKISPQVFGPGSDFVKTIPVDACTIIFSYLTMHDLSTCLLVSRKWKQIAGNDNIWKKLIYSFFAFNKDKWLEYFGLKITDEPELPNNLIQILKEKSTYGSVFHDFDLILAPSNMNLDGLNNLVHHPKKGFKNRIATYPYSLNNIFLKQSKWFLLSKLNIYDRKRINREPYVFEALLAISVNLVKNNCDYHYWHPDYSACLEKDMFVGDYGTGGLSVMHFPRGSDKIRLSHRKVREICSLDYMDIPTEIFISIFSFLTLIDLINCKYVSKKWKLIADDKALLKTIIYTNVAFNKHKWFEYLGINVEEKVLPRDIVDILKEKSPINRKHSVFQDFYLTLAPANIILKRLNEFFNEPKKGFRCKFSDLTDECSYLSIKDSQWVLMSRVKNQLSCNKTYPQQQILVATLISYRIPSVFEAAVSILTHFVRTGKVTCSTYFTRCIERAAENHQMCIGNFSNRILDIIHHPNEEQNMFTVALVRDL